MRIFVMDKRRSVMFFALVACAVLMIAFGLHGTTGVFSDVTEKKLPIYSVDRGEEKVCALTFDAAWDDADTDVLIRILEKYNAPSTFFTVGTWVEKYPQSVKKLSDAGHEIMNHSDTHPHIAELSDVKIKEEMKKCSDKIQGVCGVRPILFRGPYGEYTNDVIEEAAAQGMQTIQWDVDSLDWKNLSAEEITQRVVKRVHPGAVVLFHNGAKNMPAALPGILETLKAQGYRFVKASELIYHEEYIIDSTGKQIQK